LGFWLVLPEHTNNQDVGAYPFMVVDIGWMDGWMDELEMDGWIWWSERESSWLSM
jgi:hypothetical protein